MRNRKANPQDVSLPELRASVTLTFRRSRQCLRQQMRLMRPAADAAGPGWFKSLSTSTLPSRHAGRLA